MLLASAVLPLEPTVTRDRNRSAVFTKVAAGRACSAPPAGSGTVDSELGGPARLFGGSRHVFERLARRRHHRGRDGTLDERRVDQPNMTIGLALEQVANGEDGAAEVGQHDHALSAVGPGDRLAHRVPARTEGSAGAPPPTLALH